MWTFLVGEQELYDLVSSELAQYLGTGVFACLGALVVVFIAKTFLTKVLSKIVSTNENANATLKEQIASAKEQIVEVGRVVASIQTQNEKITKVQDALKEICDKLDANDVNRLMKAFYDYIASQPELIENGVAKKVAYELEIGMDELQINEKREQEKEGE